jgi:hypothetical protein
MKRICIIVFSKMILIHVSMSVFNTPSGALLDVVLALCEECAISYHSPLPREVFMV